MTDKIYLYGPPASGKTTLGRMLAETLGTACADTDAEIVAERGRPISNIFASEGESAFRKMECAALQRAAESSSRVVSLGGGTLLDENNRRLCEKTGTVICLTAPSAEELARRLGENPGSRPLGDRSVERAPHYASFANRITSFFELKGSLVIVGEGIAPAFLEGERLVVDENVARIHPELKPLAVQPSGESEKTPASVAAMWTAFSRGGLGRRDLVAAVGGGVTGDLTGFAAATWMRGIDWLNFPTTLLSMVDSSIGGKTGCDLPEGKNLVGAFHPPKLVVVDAEFLKTLPPDLLIDGKAEMIKHAIISGGERRFAEVPTAAEIAANLAVKASVVREDPFEKLGIRQKLNCGHTIGHAVEKASAFALSHGKSVAIGCVEEARLAVEMGLAPSGWPEELSAVFAAAGLPTAFPDGMDFSGLKRLMRSDKKKLSGDSVAFALPCGWGDVRIVKVSLA